MFTHVWIQGYCFVTIHGTVHPAARHLARVVIDKMRAENILKMEGKGKLSRYIKVDD